MPSLQRLSSCALLVALLVGATACSEIGPDTCSRPESDEPTVYNGGFVEGGTYMSSDWYGDLLPFPGGAYYEIHHQLGEVPQGVQMYLSFAPNGLTGGSIAQAAGNQAELKLIDDEKLVVLNGSCAEYWLLVVAWVGDPA